MAINTFSLLIAIVLASSATAAMAAPPPDEQGRIYAEPRFATRDEELKANDDSLFGWPFFTNNNHQSIDLIKIFRCHTSVHRVYSCLRLSLFKFPPQRNFDLFHPAAAEDCCPAISNFRDQCGDFSIAKFETFIFPPLLFKRCAVNDPPAATTPAPVPVPAPAPEPDTADDETAADVEIEV
ncbi:hypothetical protein OSB04_030115 [Centaurea solstitialis]|uniref:Prolamin-like domain-containing protein n=1 Tax=Centaurea solstitialis TaxID=347529 RepID=A0AA38VSX7_9ASTR|nr:hypothetical protein OSB04_030115 [Centaurea solstitialis]